jgi:hypothetical protein
MIGNAFQAASGARKMQEKLEAEKKQTSEV